MQRLWFSPPTPALRPNGAGAYSFKWSLDPYSIRKEPIPVFCLSLITLLMESSGNCTSRASTRGCGLQVLDMLDLYTLAGLEQYCSEIICVQTLLLIISAPSMSSSCYGDISALQAPTISCTPARTSDCGMNHSLLDLSSGLYLTERYLAFCYCQIKCGAAIQSAKRKKVTLPLPKLQVKPPDLHVP